MTSPTGGQLSSAAVRSVEIRTMSRDAGMSGTVRLHHLIGHLPVVLPHMPAQLFGAEIRSRARKTVPTPVIAFLQHFCRGGIDPAIHAPNVARQTGGNVSRL